jgi:hypothetical protein
MTDADLTIIVDALIGNTTLKKLDIMYNILTCKALFDLARLLESTHLKSVSFGMEAPDRVVLDNETSQRFARALSNNKFMKTLYNCSTPSSPSIGVWRALESNSTLASLRFPVAMTHQAVDQLAESLPKMKGIQRLYLEDYAVCMQNVAFLPALHKNTSIVELGHRPSSLPLFFPNNGGDSMFVTFVQAVDNILKRNQALRYC